MAPIGKRLTRAFVIGMGMAFLVGLGFYFLVTGVNLIATTPTYVPVIVNGTLDHYAIAPSPGAPFNATAIMFLAAGGILALALGVELSSDLTDNSQQSSPQLTQQPQFILQLTPEGLAALVAQGQKKTDEGPPKPT
jgi:hypothetical protein